METVISSISTSIFHYMLLDLLFTSPLLYFRRCFSSSLSIWTPSLVTSLTLSTTTHYRHFFLTSSTPTVVTLSFSSLLHLPPSSIITNFIIDMAHYTSFQTSNFLSITHKLLITRITFSLVLSLIPPV